MLRCTDHACWFSCFRSGYIWDAGLALCEYIANEAVFAKGHWAGRRGIELGSGTGLCGIVAAALDCDIVITDIGGHVALIEQVSARFPSKLATSLSHASCVACPLGAP